MNNRIEELAALADQQTLTYIARTDVEIDSTEFNAVKLEKFAELIVRECCKEITSEPFNAGAASGWLKQHFGIEDEQSN